MKNVDIAVIGSGIGGSLISALNKNKDLILFEKDKNLGGCASTFKRNAAYFNTGATTFVGYENNHPIKNIFDEVGVIPNIVESKIAIRTIQNRKIVDRIQNFEEFLTNLNNVYYHKNNKFFWKTIKEIDERFWTLKKVYFAKYGFQAYVKTALFVAEFLKEFGFMLFKTADGYINEILPNISKEYKAFINAQLLITLQTTSKDLSLLAMSLGLAYPFHKVFYPIGGMGQIIEDLLKDVNVSNKEEIISIKKEQNKYRLISTKDEYLASKVILNSAIFESSKLFLDENIKKYYDKFSFSDQSAFVVYLKLDSKEKFLHHYQIILKDNIPNCISNSFFVSVSDINDEKLSKDGYSITISTHSKAIFWEGLTKDEYEAKKEFTQNFIIKEFLNNFDNIKQENIKTLFSATSKTFYRYINRSNCGGKPITAKTIFQLPSCNTPFDGLYNVGDTVFAGQGWPGVAIGVGVLNKELNAKVELKIAPKDWLYIIIIGALFGFFISLCFYFVSYDLQNISTIIFSTGTAIFISLFAFLLITISNKFILPKVNYKFWYLISFIFSFLSGFFGFSFSFLLFSFGDFRILDIISPFWIYISITIGFLTFLVGLILHQFISMKYKNEEIKTQILETKLKALENELNPHFLFNALNSVSELIYQDPKKAENAVIEISKFLRNAINKDSLISLETELSMVKTYVNIENVRFSEKIVLHIKDFSEFKNIKIPKFSIQLLVENAIKHGYLGKTLNIDINFSKDKIMVQNDGKIANIVKFGTGLSNLQKRLELQKVGSLRHQILDDKMVFIIELKG